MKACLTALLLSVAGFSFLLLAAEPTEADRKQFQEIYSRAETGDAKSQFELGTVFDFGKLGVTKDEVAAAKWYRKAAVQNYAPAQFKVGSCYSGGRGVEKDFVEAVKWFLKAAELNDTDGQTALGLSYAAGLGVERNLVEAYAWSNLAARTEERASEARRHLEREMSPQQVAEAQKRTKELRAWIEAKPSVNPNSRAGVHEDIASVRPKSSGTGFFISEDGYFITNQHVAGEGATVRLVTAAGLIAAKVVKVDKANDLALLKAEGKFTALPVITSRGVRLGATAATVGFPNTGLQGFAPKLARGEIASLAGAQDDARHFQISAPIQPGNSGGALVDERGNVIGVVVAKLSQRAALATSGALAENVNYAVKSSYLLSFLESVPEVAAKLKEAHTKDRKFEDVVKSVEQATVLVLVY